MKAKVILILSILALGAGAGNAHAGGKPIGTVERPSGGNAATKIQWKKCVIDLTAPKEKGRCELGLYDTVDINPTGWWQSDTLAKFSVLPESSGDAKLYYLDEAARLIMEWAKKKRDPHKFWGAVPLEQQPGLPHKNILPPILNPDPGETKQWRIGNVYTDAELKKAMLDAIQWADAWRRYRGAKFGTAYGNGIPDNSGLLGEQ